MKLTSVENGECIDEECLPYLRVRFADGVELLADDAELFSFDPKMGELLAAVAGAFAVARDMEFVGPWSVAAHGTAEEQEKFLEAYKNFKVTLPLGCWATNHNAPTMFREAALKSAVG